MSAPEFEPTPTAEHTDAVAREPASIVGEFIDDAALMHACRSIGTVASFNVATDLLTSTDPAVHAAMLDALVRAGVLTEDRERLVRACGCIANEEPAACCDPLASPHWERRLVTPWEVAP